MKPDPGDPGTTVLAVLEKTGVIYLYSIHCLSVYELVWGVSWPGPAAPAACHLAEAPDTAGPPSSVKVKHTSS